MGQGILRMWTKVTAFFVMGGYAAYVWPAYAALVCWFVYNRRVTRQQWRCAWRLLQQRLGNNNKRCI